MRAEISSDWNVWGLLKGAKAYLAKWPQASQQAFDNYVKAEMEGDYLRELPQDERYLNVYLYCWTMAIEYDWDERDPSEGDLEGARFP